MPALKRLRLEALNAPELSKNHPDLAALSGTLAQEYRAWAVGKHVSGEWNATDLAINSWYHTETGGEGLEDLAVHPKVAVKHASDHVKMVLAGEVPDPDLVPIEVPVFDKYRCVRSKRKMPFRSLHLEFARNPPAPPSTQTDWPESFTKHPVTLRALERGVPAEQIRPVALYQDGVSFTNKDSFEGFFLKDLITGISYLQFLMRTKLSIFRTHRVISIPENY